MKKKFLQVYKYFLIIFTEVNEEYFNSVYTSFCKNQLTGFAAGCS